MMVLHSLWIGLPPKKKVKAAMTTPAIAAMAADSFSHCGTPSSTLTGMKVGLSAGAACRLSGASPSTFSNAGFRCGGAGISTPWTRRRFASASEQFVRSIRLRPLSRGGNLVVGLTMAGMTEPLVPSGSFQICDAHSWANSAPAGNRVK
jgi:hypothetical protein